MWAPGPLIRLDTQNKRENRHVQKDLNTYGIHDAQLETSSSDNGHLHG